MKRKISLLMLFFFLPLLIFVQSFESFGQESGGVGGGSWSSSSDGYLGNHSRGRTEVLLLTKPARKDAHVFSFRVNLYVDALVSSNQLAVPFEKIGRGEVKNIRLAADLNSNGVYDEKDELVGGEGIIKDGKIIFALRFTISVATDFLVISDLSQMDGGFKMAFSLSGQDFTLEGGKTLFSSADAVTHNYGNPNAPILSWTDEQGVTKRGFRDCGVEPMAVKSGDYIRIRVKYSDKDGHRPQKAEVWFDFDGDGQYEQKEPLKKETGGFYDSGVIYSLANKKVYFEGQKKSAYRFYFTDGDKEAAGVPSEGNFFEVYPWIVFELNGSPKEMISGEIIEISGYVNWYEGTKADFDSLSKFDPKPFVLENFSLGKKRGHPR